MNTDFMVWDELIREKQFEKNMMVNGHPNYYDDSCKTIRKYAREQNTIYDPITNQMLYGINSNMHASGVSDGTCNQINPLIFTPRYKCGAGAAGGNRCVPDAYPKAYSIENFGSNNCNCYNITEFVIALLLLIFFIGFIYTKQNDIKL